MGNNGEKSLEDKKKRHLFFFSTVQVSHIQVRKTNTGFKKDSALRQRISAEKTTRMHRAYTHHNVRRITSTYTHARTMGVLSLMAARSESEMLTSPANTVHPV